jgi:hypothetical protein
MSKKTIPGFGRKRPQLNIPIARLYLDSENPRLPEEAQGKGESELLGVLYKEFNLEELGDSMAKNGYFDEEPLVVIPRKLPKSLEGVDFNSQKFLTFINDDSTEFTVVEGNRRLATIKLLLDLRLREKVNIKNWLSISNEVANDLKILPAIVYSKRSEVVPYLGLRHIVGIRKWESYAKARYIAKMVEDGLSVKEVEAHIGGDRQGSAIRSYLSYKLFELVRDEFDLDTKQAEKDFSLLILAVGQGDIKRFLGLPRKLSEVNFDSPVPSGNVENLRHLFYWIFGDGKRRAVINESRDITTYLSHVVSSSEAVSYLEKTGDLLGAYDRTDGEEQMLLKYLNTANLKLEGALGIVHRHKTPEVVIEVGKCKKTVEALLKTLKEPND